MQVGGSMKPLLSKIKANGIPVLWHGALAAWTATVVGHFPWFAVYNYLNVTLPKPNNTLEKLARSAVMGFSASVVSDTISNSIRVIKTVRQTYETKISYVQAAKTVIDKDGVAGLFGRGLKTRLLANGMQGIMFSIIWRFVDDWMQNKGN
jgi:hypothetical protein